MKDNTGEPGLAGYHYALEKQCKNKEKGTRLRRIPACVERRRKKDEKMEIIKILIDRREFFLQCFAEHIAISLSAVLMASVLGIAAGIFISYHKKLETPVLSVVNVIYTIPSIALLGFLIPFTGIGNKTAIIALTIYGLLPIVRTTHTGFTTLDKNVREAAMSAGATNWQIITKVELPMAFPVIFSGFRNMVVMVIAMSGIASFIGAGGLGAAVFRGISTYNMTLTAAGALLIAILALFTDWVLGKAERAVCKRLGMDDAE